MSYWLWDGASSYILIVENNSPFISMVNNIAGDGMATQLSQWLL